MTPTTVAFIVGLVMGSIGGMMFTVLGVANARSRDREDAYDKGRFDEAMRKP